MPCILLRDIFRQKFAELGFDGMRIMRIGDSIEVFKTFIKPPLKLILIVLTMPVVGTKHHDFFMPGVHDAFALSNELFVKLFPVT